VSKWLKILWICVSPTDCVIQIESPLAAGWGHDMQVTSHWNDTNWLTPALLRMGKSGNFLPLSSLSSLFPLPSPFPPLLAFPSSSLLYVPSSKPNWRAWGSVVSFPSRFRQSHAAKRILCTAILDNHHFWRKSRWLLLVLYICLLSLVSSAPWPHN